MTKTETLSQPTQPTIKKEIKRIEKLLKEKSVDEKIIKLNQHLIFQTAFMGLQLKKLAIDIDKNGVTEQYCNGANQYGIKKSASADVYGTMIKSYMTAQKQINDLIPKSDESETEKNDGFDEFCEKKQNNFLNDKQN